LYLIASGAVKLTRSDANGREVIVGLHLPGFLLAIAAAILEAPHPDTALALGWCEVHRISVREFRDLRRQSAAFVRSVAHALALEERRHVVRAGRSGLDTQERLVVLLRDLARSCGRVQPNGWVRLDVRLTQADLGGLIAASREQVNRLFPLLESRGVLRRSDGWLLVRVDGKANESAVTNITISA